MQKQINSPLDNKKDEIIFTVIIPMHNAASFIKNAITSVLTQTVSNFEIIIVDDGSTDESKTVVFEIGDSRIHYIYQVNNGVSAARNTGIRNAKGNYICFLDADDMWMPNHLEVILDLIVKYPDCGVYLTGHKVCLHDGKTVNKRYSDNDYDLLSENVFKNIWEKGYFIHTNSIVCKAIVFDKVGLFEVGVKNGEDDDMWYRLFSYYSVAISNEITTTYIRANSKATVSKIFVEDWIFLRRVNDIMGDDIVLAERKEYLKRLLEQRKLSAVRNNILQGNKKEAWKKLLQLDIRLLKPKKYLETILALLLPSKISIKAVEYRDRKYYLK